MEVIQCRWAIQPGSYFFLSNILQAPTNYRLINEVSCVTEDQCIFSIYLFSMAITKVLIGFRKNVFISSEQNFYFIRYYTILFTADYQNIPALQCSRLLNKMKYGEILDFNKIIEPTGPFSKMQINSSNTLDTREIGRERGREAQL